MLAVLAVVLVAGGVWVSRAMAPGGILGSGSGDLGERFSFPPPRVTSSSLSHKRPMQLRAAVDGVTMTLSALYDGLFVHPGSWAEEPVPEVWSVFSPAAATRARRDVRSLTFGNVAPTVERVDVKGAKLAVRLLFDANANPVAAVAKVRFDATGLLAEGRRFVLANRASYLLRPVRGQWLIVGYPSARTKVRERAPTPGSSPPAET